MQASSFIGDCQERLSDLRKHIHAHPELSNQEHNTTKTLISFFKSLKSKPDIIEDVGGGFLVVFQFDKTVVDDVTIVFRSELDAIPVQERNDFEHKSVNPGVAHHCGHDGHMAILAGLATFFDHFAPIRGKVVLLYQPAEETGAGAVQMVSSTNPVIRSIRENKDTRFFALHNVPGFPLGSIILPQGTSFASASKGMHIKLAGRCAHASQPHTGKNPALAMCNIVQGLLAIPTLHVPFDQKAMITIVGARVGEKAFGVSAGDAEVMATLRATTNATLALIEANGVALCNGIAAAYGLDVTINFEDDFTATINDPECISIVNKAAVSNQFKIVAPDAAFPWSEDFGIFLQSNKGAMFGLGAGESQPPVHDDKYDFPDSLISYGVTIFASIVEHYLGAFLPV